jgi:hypothetical protein
MRCGDIKLSTGGDVFIGTRLENWKLKMGLRQEGNQRNDKR